MPLALAPAHHPGSMTASRSLFSSRPVQQLGEFPQFPHHFALLRPCAFRSFVCREDINSRPDFGLSISTSALVRREPLISTTHSVGSFGKCFLPSQLPRFPSIYAPAPALVARLSVVPSSRRHVESQSLLLSSAPRLSGPFRGLTAWELHAN